jgi:CRISPR-associated protein Cmr1
MQEVIFNLQTITPLFMAGTDYKSISIPQNRRQGKHTYAEEGWDLQAEVRPPSFRGLMRYWLRAAFGGLSDITTINLKDVSQFEQNTFGSTERGSAISIRITDVSRKAKQFRKDKESYSQETITGRDYLLWSMAASRKGEDYRPDRWYFPEGTHFKVMLSERSADSTALQKLPYAIASLWLLTYLGGIGSRSHRCGGSLQVQHVVGNTGNLPFIEAANREELQMILRQGIREIRDVSATYLQALQKRDEDKILAKADFDCLSLLHEDDLPSSPHHCRIWILTQDTGSSWSSLKDAMNTIGTRLKIYRSSLTPLDRAVFGLPLNTSLQNKTVERALKDSRRASPLLLRITKLGSVGYVGVVVLFKTAASPIIDPNNRRILVPAPDYSLIERWIITAFPQALEVRL